MSDSLTRHNHNPHAAVGDSKNLQKFRATPFKAPEFINSSSGTMLTRSSPRLRLSAPLTAGQGT
eukprot:CAMPEP_0167824670 /NCGR_PEP_ID=MMETSP0112_2-20121227/8926_1 /TAXON_ID=91324 /ORGANISM="Lotharella globosa, Strain CCCM811" /LENGTH=63 /DNA_ID=CAMNT_0007726665 /DNA_START=208 /DNA_END=399 /DNA_ORIENTATION=+